MNNHIRLNRLEHSLTVLKKIPKKKFGMGRWMNLKNFDEPLDIHIPNNFVNVSCTSAACFLGWLAMDKRCRRAGLDWYDRHGSDGIKFKSREDQYAGAEYFGISTYEAEELFLPNRYGQQEQNITTNHVSEKVIDLIKKYKSGGGDEQL